MITLHESNITSFPLDNGIGVLSDAIRAYAEEELNGMFEFYMEYDSEGHLVDELKEERIIKAKAQDKLGYQLFRIYSITKNHENDNIIVNAQHITYDLANNFVEKMEANRLTKKQVMEKIGNSTVESHPFNMTSSNTTTVSSTNLYRTNPLQMVAGMEGSVLQIWGGQLERDNFNFILHDRRGHDDGVTVTFEKNITGLTAEFDISGVITRIFPFIYIEATDDEPERLITVDGKYIDSPHINDYEVIRTEPIDYSSDDRINTDNKTDAQIRQQLTNVAKNYFKETGNDKVKSEMEVQFAHLWETEEYKDVKVLELVGMGDTVTINHSKLKVDATAIVNYIKYDCIAQVNEEVKLGRVKARLTDNVNKIDTIERKVEQAQTSANQAIVSANGKNTTYYGPDEPTTGMQKGDLWFKVIDGQYHKTYRYDGIDWQEILDMDSQEAKEEARQAQERADEAVERANQATEEANKAIGQAQASFDLAQESLTLGQGLTSRMTDAEGNLTALNQTTQSLAGQLSDVEGNITTLTATVNGLQTTVSDVQGNVANLTVISNAMQARLSNAEGNINTLTLTSQSMQSTISSLQDEWDNLEIGGRNFLLNTTTESLTLDNPNSFDTVSINGITVSPNFLESAKGKKVTISIEARSTGYEKGTSPWIGVECVYYQNDGTTRYITVQLHSTLDTDGEWRRYSRTVSLPLDISSMRNSVTMLIRNIKGFVQTKQPKLEIGNKATDWSPAPEDMATQTQITQLSDAINLRVAKGDVINQINLDTSGVLIGGDKILLDGNVTVTGDFKLDGSAHIKDASIGTAQIGTIDAAIANIINLSANSIVGGMLQSQNDNITFNLNRSEFIIRSGGQFIFQDSGNGIKYVRNNHSAGMIMATSLNYNLPMTAIGVDSGNGVINANSSDFTGIRIHSREASHNNSLVGGVWQFTTRPDYSTASIIVKTDGSTGGRGIFPQRAGTYNYDLGTGANYWNDFYIKGDILNQGVTTIRDNTGVGGWRIETRADSGSTTITLRGINTNQRNYNLGESGYRINRIYLSNSPDVSSDERLKTDISNNTLGLDFINDVNTINYRLNKLPCDVGNLKQNGVIAQQLLPVLVKHGVDVNDTMLVRLNDDGYYSVAYEQFIAPLIKSVQELDTKLTDNVDFLKLKVQYLEQKIKLLEEKVA